MNNEVEKRLAHFMFPVTEREVFFESKDGGIPLRTNNYKAVTRGSDNQLISIMKNTYKIIPNREVIMPLLEQLDKLDTTWLIDNSHSFVDISRMRLQVTFPELVLNDGRSDIALSLFLHNSYDGSEGVRMYWGAIRGICSNGMVFGEVLSQFYGRHTSGINLSDLKEKVEATYEKIPVIKHRIELLQNLKVTSDLRNDVTKKLGKGVTNFIEQQEKAKNQWMLYNILTYYISHAVKQRMRAHYQFEVSKLFNL